MKAISTFRWLLRRVWSNSQRGDPPVKAISAFGGCSAECEATLKGEIRQ